MSLTKVSYAMITGAPINVMDYGAVGNGVTNDTSAIQAALDYAGTLAPLAATYTYGTVCVEVPFGIYLISSVTIPSGVGLVCSAGIAIFKASSAGVMVDTTVYSSGTVPHYNGMLQGIHLYGMGSGTAVSGLRINNAQNFVVQNCRAYNLAGYAIQIQSKWTGAAFTGTATSNTCSFTEVRVFDCCLNVASRTGAFDVAGTDHEFNGCEVFSKITRVGSGAGTKYQVAWRLFGCTEARFISCKGSVMDQGLYIDSNSFLNFFTDWRSDGNFYEAIYIDGTINQFDMLDLNGNGITTTNTYDQLVFSSNTSRNYINSGYFSAQNNGATILPRYNIVDNGTDAANANRVGPMVYFTDAGTASINNTSGKLSVILSEGISSLFTANSTTPSVTNGTTPLRNWKTNNSVPTSVTNFTNGFIGQILTLEGGDANTTIVNGATIVNITGANITMGGNKIVNYRLNSSLVWMQY